MLHHSTVDPSTFSLLQGIFKLPFVRNNFGLAGRTSLALQIGHRKSIDLDLFTPNAFLPDLENLLASHSGWTYEPANRMERMLFCNINRVKCDFVHEPFPLIQPFIEEESIKLYSIPDIAAMKMHTVCGRGKKKDFFDIYALLQLYDWKQMLSWFNQKYGDSQFFYLWTSITYFSDAEHDVDVRGIHLYNTSWEIVKKTIIEKCR